MDRPFTAILRRYGTRPAVLAQAASVEAAFGPKFDIRSQLGSEVVVDRAVLEKLHPKTLLVNAMKRAWEATLISHWRRVYGIIAANPGDLLHQYKAVKRFDDEEHSRCHRREYEFAAVLLPDETKVWQKVMFEEAIRSDRQVMIALLQYRARTGHFPKTLAVLPAPGAPADPCADAPLHYHRTETGFTVYSIGPDLHDDGGDETKGVGGMRRDIVLRYPS